MMNLDVRKEMLRIRILELKAQIPQAEREMAAAEGQLMLINELQEVELHTPPEEDEEDEE